MLLFILWGIGDMHEWKLWNMESLYILPLVGQCKTGFVNADCSGVFSTSGNQWKYIKILL